MNHYVYYAYEEWGRGYIGSRTCECLPEEDIKYFGSFSDKKFNPTGKIILGLFSKLEEAIEAEVKLHNFYEVDINPHFANRAKQTSSKFYFKASGENHPRWGKTHSYSHSHEAKKKLSEANRGENNPMWGGKYSEKQKASLSRIKHQQGAKNSMYGTMWITNGTKEGSYRIKKNEAIPSGYRKGRVCE